ncbi:MAG: Methyltransferase domain protein [Candidatus Bathyarchaeota archaeon BA1]|nr:MAG: Methyltransferase domain protein [Candidatus Bathyarchaeota archaeon BA1]
MHNVFPVQGDGFHLPFKDEAFDGVTLNWFIAHIPHVERKEFLREVKGFVRRDSWLIISDSYWRGQDGGRGQVQTRLAAGKQYQVYKYY